MYISEELCTARLAARSKRRDGELWTAIVRMRYSEAQKVLRIVAKVVMFLLMLLAACSFERQQRTLLAGLLAFTARLVGHQSCPFEH